MTNKRIEEFQKKYDDAIERIKKYLEPDPNLDPPMNELVRWMMETESNSWGYLTGCWRGAPGSAEAFVSLLDNIHHALYDDGDIAFVTVEDEPRIVFAWIHDDEQLKTNSLNEDEKYWEMRDSRKFDIKILDIKPNEFGILYDQYEKNRVKKQKNFQEFLEEWQKKNVEPA